ncbi:MAG: aldo/keto reductase [Sphaerochaetaceae bacterium]
MIYREFGKTGKTVSAVGFGAMRFKREEYEKGDFSTSAKIVQHAHKKGVTYFDTAPDYCDGQSENILGEAFKQMERSSFYVSTKCGLHNATTADKARAMVEQSLTRMGLDYIDFYSMWCIKTPEEYREVLKKGGIYEGALKAQQEGLIKHVCFTTHLSGEEIADVAHDDLFEAVTLGYNAINFAYRQKGIDACYDAGLGIVTMNPLGGGIIPQYPDYFSFLQRGDDSLVVSALKFILSQNKATVVLPGMSSIQEVDENVLAAENLQSSSQNMLDEMATHLNTELNTLCTTCAYCDMCPEGIPIPRLLDSYNMYILTNGDKDALFSRIKNHWEIDPQWAAACTACGQCETLCTQKLPIIARLATIAEYL